MVIKIDCPWCDHSVHDDTYPPSAGHSKAKEKLESHFQNKHPDKQRQYKKIQNVWNDVNLDYGGVINFYIQFLRDRFDDISFNGTNVPRNVVDEYDPEELEDLNRDEMRRRFSRLQD